MQVIYLLLNKKQVQVPIIVKSSDHNLELEKIERALSRQMSKDEFFHAVVNVPFKSFISAHYDIGTIVLLIDNKKSGYIERVALSKTAAAEGAVGASAIPFESIKIPRDYKKSSHVRALKKMQPILVTDWHEMFTPALSKVQARDNQHGSGILTSVVYPFKGKLAGTIIFSLFVDAGGVTNEAHSFFDWYTNLVSDRLSAVTFR